MKLNDYIKTSVEGMVTYYWFDIATLMDTAHINWVHLGIAPDSSKNGYKHTGDYWYDLAVYMANMNSEAFASMWWMIGMVAHHTFSAYQRRAITAYWLRKLSQEYRFRFRMMP